MEIKQIITEGISLIDKSSIKSNELIQAKKNLTQIYESCTKTLKIVLMGTIKSGKSTFFNALAGQVVSPIGASETTSKIIQLEYSPIEEGYINLTTDEFIKKDINEIFSILNTQDNNNILFHDCISVLIKKNLKNLKKITIVDTPGLSTLTRKNIDTTKNYIQKADVVLWVLNGNYLGQYDEQNELEEIYEMGKPIIGIINHVDDEANADDLIEYVEDNSGEYFQKIFTLSAKQALDGILHNDKEKIIKSRYFQIMDYLENNIEKNDKEIKNISVLDSIKAQLDKCRYFYITKKEQYEDKDKQLKEIRLKIKEARDQVEKVIINKMNDFDINFCQNLYSNACNKIDSIGIINSKNKIDSINDEIKNIFSKENVDIEYNNFIRDLEEHIKNEWKKQIQTIQNQYISFNNRTSIGNVDKTKTNLSSINTDFESITDSLLTGIIGGSITGGLTSVFAAQFGTYAAHLSIMGALGSVMLPALAIGAVSGIILGKHKNDSNKNKAKEEIRRALTTLKRQIKEEEFPKIKNLLKQYNNKFEDNLFMGIVIESFPKGLTELSLLIKNLNHNAYAFEELIKQLPKYETVTKPFEEELKLKDEQINELLKKMRSEQDEFIRNVEEINSLKNNKILKDNAIKDVFNNSLILVKKELDIISPWLNTGVVNTKMINNFEQLLKKGVIIKIIYGIGDENSINDNRNQRTNNTIYMLKEHFKDYSNFKTMRKNTHAKLFICDDEYYVLTSFNILSFDYSYEKNIYNKRNEIGEQSFNKEILNKYRSQYFNF